MTERGEREKPVMSHWRNRLGSYTFPFPLSHDSLFSGQLPQWHKKTIHAVRASADNLVKQIVQILTKTNWTLIVSESVFSLQLNSHSNLLTYLQWQRETFDKK